MKVLVRGKNCRVPRAVRALAEEKVARLTRLARDAGRAEVEFSETGHHHSPPSTDCEVTIHLRRDVVRGRAAAPDASSALDRTLEKVEHQLQKRKDKRVSRAHGGRRPDGSSRVAADGPGLEPSDWAAPPERAGDRGETPHIVRRAPEDVKPMSPDEAALQLDLLGYEFLLFSNSESGNAAVIYRRRDGDLGLVETTG